MDRSAERDREAKRREKEAKNVNENKCPSVSGRLMKPSRDPFSRKKRACLFPFFSRLRHSKEKNEEGEVRRRRLAQVGRVPKVVPRGNNIHVIRRSGGFSRDTLEESSITSRCRRRKLSR